MEVREIVSYFFNPQRNTLSVKFRFLDDTEDEIREDIFDIEESIGYGYSIITETFDLFSEMYDDEEIESEDLDNDVDEHQLMLFMQELYTIEPQIIPIKIIF